MNRSEQADNSEAEPIRGDAGLVTPAGWSADIAELSRLRHALKIELGATASELRQIAGLPDDRAPGPEPADPRSSAEAELLLAELRQSVCSLQLQVQDLDARCSAATELAATNCARIEEMVQSRTWRALTALGGLLLRVKRS